MKDQNNILIDLVISNIDQRDILLERSGAGLVELAHISALLSHTSAKVVFFDEPGSNVFPAKQRRIIQELMNSHGQFIIVTHSPFLIPPKEISSIRRIYKQEGFSFVTKKYNFEENPKQQSKVLQIVSRSSDALSLLFESCVILVEGDSESTALPIWFQKSNSSQGRAMDEFNIKTIAVNGKKSFREYVNFLETFNVAWLLLCDGDAKEYILDVFKSDDDHKRIFLRGEADNDNFETLTVVDKLKQEAVENVGHSKPRQAQWIAEQSECPEEFEPLFEKAIEMASLFK